MPNGTVTLLSNEEVKNMFYQAYEELKTDANPDYDYLSGCILNYLVVRSPAAGEQPLGTSIGKALEAIKMYVCHYFKYKHIRCGQEISPAIIKTNIIAIMTWMKAIDTYVERLSKKEYNTRILNDLNYRAIPYHIGVARLLPIGLIDPGEPLFNLLFCSCEFTTAQAAKKFDSTDSFIYEIALDKDDFLFTPGEENNFLNRYVNIKTKAYYAFKDITMINKYRTYHFTKIYDFIKETLK